MQQAQTLSENSIEALLNQLEHLKFTELGDQVEVCLIDASGYEIIRGYGENFIDAINDLHSNLL